MQLQPYDKPELNYLSNIFRNTKLVWKPFQGGKMRRELSVILIIFRRNIL